MLSRTPSPTKSPRRIALSSKDNNIRQPSLKSSSLQYSPKKPLSRTQSSSPKKSKPIPQLGFTIFSDSKDYSAELALASSLKITQDENDLISNKENLAPKAKNQLQNTHKRKHLADLSIGEFAGFIQYHDASVKKSTQVRLDSIWTNDDSINIPSYATPPRLNRIKYISFPAQKVNQMKRSSSLNDIQSEKVVKKILFSIHQD